MLSTESAPAIIGDIMNYTQGKQLKKLAVVGAGSAIIAAVIVMYWFATMVAIYANTPLSTSEGLLNWMLVPVANFLTAVGPWTTFCVMFALTYLAGVALFMFPPALRVRRVRN